jgi:hypothetical protein
MYSWVREEGIGAVNRPKKEPKRDKSSSVALSTQRRAAMPSSPARTAYKSAKARIVKLRTKKPWRLRCSMSFSPASRLTASLMGVGLTSREAASSFLLTRTPGASVPSRIMAFSRA